MKRTIFATLLLLTISVGSQASTKIGDLYYNLNASAKTAEVTYEVQNSSSNYSTLTSVAIPSTVTDANGVTYSVTSIGNAAFYDCSGLTSVTIPSSVSSIKNAVFSGCSALTSVTIPNAVTSIGNAVFSGCIALTSVTIPNEVSSIGDYAFSGCDRLAEVYNLSKLTITAGNPDNGFVAYYAKKVHTSATEKSILVHQGDYTFAYADGKGYLINYTGKNTSTTLPSSFTYDGNAVSTYGINDYAFYDCSTLTSLTIPNAVSSIGDFAFACCSALTSLTIPNAVSSIGEGAFLNCSALTSLTIPNAITSIEDYAFQYCSALTSVTIPNTVSSIGGYAFSGCSALTSLTIPNSVLSIGYAAFSGCSALTSLTIPSSVSSIENYAFRYCNRLTSVTSEASTPPLVSSETFEDVSATIPVYVPCNSVNAYKKTIDWSSFTAIQAIDGSCDATEATNASLANAKVYTQGKEIIVAFENDQAANVQIYDLGGKMVYSSANGDVDFDAPQSGVYVVKIGNQSTKAVVK